MIGPGRDDNYPSSSGNVGRGMGNIFSTSFSIDGMTISVGLLLLIVVALLMWGILKK